MIKTKAKIIKLFIMLTKERRCVQFNKKRVSEKKDKYTEEMQPLEHEIRET